MSAMSISTVKQTTKLSFASLLAVCALLFALVAYGAYKQSAHNQWSRSHVAHIEALSNFSLTFDTVMQNIDRADNENQADRAQLVQASLTTMRTSLKALDGITGAGGEFPAYYESLRTAVGDVEVILISDLALGAADQGLTEQRGKAVNAVRSIVEKWKADDVSAYESVQAENLSSLNIFSGALIAGFLFLFGLLVAVMGFVQRKVATFSDSVDQASNESKRNHLMLENAVSGVITIDERGIVQSFNPAAERMFQYKATEVTGRNVSLLMPESHAVVHDNYLNSYITTGVAEIIGIGRELQGRRKDGSLFPMDLGVAEMPLDGGRMFIGTVTDISSRKEAQEEAVKAKMLAERANKAKSEFLSSMSHELRTPLNAILGFGQILGDDEDAPLNEDQKEAVAHILKAGEHLITLITDVLDLAKIESGKLTISVEDVAPHDSVAGCISMSRAMAMKRGIKIDDRVSALKLPNIRVDATRFKQVLLNLISNAIKYNKPKGTVIIESEQRLNGMLRIVVSDTGTGIPERLQNKLFVPFERLGHEGSQVEGSGIGLSITKELVQLMGGDVGFESEEGVGSKFWIDLPLSGYVEGLENEIAALGQAQEAPSELKAFIKKRFVGKQHALKRLLYVEDNPANTFLMESIIKSTPDYSLTTVTTAEAGLALLKDSPDGAFDLILMDINLPGMDGVEATRLLKSNPRTKDIPVIAVSAAAMASDIERAKIAGVVEYLTKPLNVKGTIALFDRTLHMAD